MKTILAAWLLICLASPAHLASAAESATDYSQISANSKTVGDAYFSAYVSRDWDAIEPLMGENNSFQDTTAEHVFGGVKQQGKLAIMSFFRKNYTSISHMEFRPIRAVYSGNYAIFEGSLDWATDIGGGKNVQSVMPFVTILRIADGQVVEHRDYADYAPFLASVRALRTPQD